MAANKRILALDLGTTTGWAIGYPGNVTSGVWNLKPQRFEGGGMRFVRFRGALSDLFDAMPFDEVYFEEVRNHKGVDAAHVYGGLMATLQSWLEETFVLTPRPYAGVPVGEIKKYWTGKGNANKAQMIAAAEALGFRPVDDNEADALALLHLKLSQQ